MMRDGLDPPDRERFWDRIAATQPDEAYLVEFAELDAATDAPGAGGPAPT
jgi:hypothetical protein